MLLLFAVWPLKAILEKKDILYVIPLYRIIRKKTVKGVLVIPTSSCQRMQKPLDSDNKQDKLSVK